MLIAIKRAREMNEFSLTERVSNEMWCIVWIHIHKCQCGECWWKNMKLNWRIIISADYNLTLSAKRINRERREERHAHPALSFFSAELREFTHTQFHIKFSLTRCGQPESAAAAMAESEKISHAEPIKINEKVLR